MRTRASIHPVGELVRSVVLATTLVVAELVVGAADAAAQVSLDPGQFSGPVRIGTRDILSATFRAGSTTPPGYSSTGGLNGTFWNGTDFSGPLDPDGYRLSVQALDPDTSANIVYNVDAGDIRTSSGLGDEDVTRFPTAVGMTVNPTGTPGDVTLVPFDEPNPWILDVEFFNVGDCPTTHIESVEVIADANYAATDWAQTKSDDSEGEVDSQGLVIRRYLDMPLLPGAGGNNVYTVHGTAHINTSGNPADGAPIVLEVSATVGPGDVVVDGMGVPHIPLSLVLDFACECPLSTLSGTVTLNGLTPADESVTTHTIDVNGPSDYYFSIPFSPGTYSISGQLQPGRYHMRAVTNIDHPEQHTFFQWPFSTHRDGDGLYYEDLSCNENGVYNFETDAAFLTGNLSFSCQARLEPSLVAQHIVFGYGLNEGVNPDGSYIGAYGGEAYDSRGGSAVTGQYRVPVSPGTWINWQHRYALQATNYSCCAPNPVTADFVNEGLDINENPRYYTNDPGSPLAIHLGPGDVFNRDFSANLSKVTISFTISGNTPAERALRRPAIGTTGYAADYYVYASAYGPDVEVQVGYVTMYLPPGEYDLGPSATRVLDGSTVTFPGIHASIQGCVDYSCSISCPSLDWTPRADSCGGEQGEVEGTASDPEGWDHIAYRVNHVPPDAGTTDGYILLTLVPTGGADNEVTFSAPITLQLGANDVELEAVDADGHRYYEHRTVYRSAGTLPVLIWTAPLNGSTTDQTSTQVQGRVTGSVLIGAVTVNGQPVTLVPDSGTPDPNDRTFNYTLPLALGPNPIVVEVSDVCGAEASETRSVTRVLPQPTASPTATFTPPSTTTPTPTMTPTPALDHFECNETHRPKISHAPLSLVDRFGTSTAQLKRAKRICAPADKNGEDPTAPTHPGHLTAYTIKQTSPHFQTTRLGVTNQFGSTRLAVTKPDRLLVPTALSETGAPAPLAAPAEHFKCYRVKGARAPGVHVTVATSFGSGVVDVKKPEHLCVPVDKSGEGILDPDAHLVCYRVRTPVQDPPGTVHTLNQFGPDEFAVFGVRELCVPSTLQP